MNVIQLITLNFSETRRRSIKLWTGIPKEHYHWKPDKDAMSIIETIRHVLETEHLYHIIMQRRGNLDTYQSPWLHQPYTTLAAELKFAEPYRNAFLEMIATLKTEDLTHVIINRTEVNQKKQLGDYLMRTAYHEAVHTGQLLDYLRTAGIARPIVWD